MDIHAIFIDLDGTLLKSDKSISMENIRAIQDIKDSIKVILSTARPPRDSKMYYDLLGIDTPIINYNGAKIHDYHSVFIKNCLSKQALKNIEHYICRAANFLVETEDGFYVKKIDQQIIEWIDSGKKEPLEIGKNVLHNISSPIYKILIKDDNNYFENFVLKILSNDLRTITSNSKSNWIDLLHANSNKYHAMMFTCNFLNIKLSNVMAIGDDLNDYEMVKNAGIGIAMGNAHPKIKEIATYITDINDSNGVAKAIKKFV